MRVTGHEFSEPDRDYLRKGVFAGLACQPGITV